MAYRRKAGMRILAFLWGIVASLIAQFIIIGALIWGVVDVVWQLLLGTEGLSSSSGVASWLRRGVMWPVNLGLFAFFGEGQMQWLP